jgi:hypothetical protein
MDILEYRQEIEARINNGNPKPEVEPKQLSIKDVVIVEGLFQHRTGNKGASDAHIRSLVKSLKGNRGKPLEPITVFWIGDGWSLIDGHHRHGAYKEDNYNKPIPVKVFTGSLDEAIGEALAGNAKDKLSMSINEKSTATWRIVISTNLSINATSAISTQSRQQVCSMRKVRDSLLAKHPDIKLGDYAWWQAKAKDAGNEKEHEFDEEWMRKEAGLLATKLSKHFGNRLKEQPEIFLMALEIYSVGLLDDLKEFLGIDPETGEQKFDYFDF